MERILGQYSEQNNSDQDGEDSRLVQYNPGQDGEDSRLVFRTI